MKSKSATLTKQLRYSKWAEEVRACEQRPVGMSINAWCREYGIKVPTFYDHLHKVKELCLDMYAETIDNGNQQLAPVIDDACCKQLPIQTFVEIPTKVEKESSAPVITISCGKSKIEISENISDDFLSRVLGALSNVK